VNASFPRRLALEARDSNGELLAGTSFSWLLDGVPGGEAKDTDGHCSIEVTNPSVVITASASYPGQEAKSVTLAGDLQVYRFTYPVRLHPRWSYFAMKHFPGLVGIFFVLLAVALVFVFKDPTALQTRVLLGLFSLGGGGFGGEFARRLKADVTLGKQLVISAGGAAAIFVILYLAVPAGTTTIP
jgi:hypothetical protein